jgi:TonB-linked SusC/RagA family outer membrane protein
MFVLLVANSYAQNKVVTGKVTDSKDGSGVQGVTVTAKGTRTATQTSADGIFNISVPGTVKSLIFSSVGYASQEVSIEGKTSVDVSFVVTNASLNEVVVTGYGTTRKRDLTTSVANVTSKDFQKGMLTTPEQLIAGKVAGVSVISNNGRPGSGSTIRIRGGSSLIASNDPLIVIDGVPLDNNAISGASNGLSFINPNDIESFSILKDASASAIYGTRGSNGVILITTKKGTSQKLKINFTSTLSSSSITKKVDVLSADELRAIVNDKGTAAQKAMLGSSNTDWQEQIYHNAISTDNNISFSGGIKKLPYRLSLGYLYQNGVLITDHLQRTSLGLSINPVLFNNHLKIDLNVRGSLEKARFGNGGAIGTAVSFDPTQPVYAKSPRFGGYFEWIDPTTSTGLHSPAVAKNPLGLLKQRFDESNPERSIGNLQLDYKFHFLPELHANANFGYDYAKGQGTIFVSDSAASDYIAGGKGGQNNRYAQTKKNTVFNFYLNYVKDLRSIHSHVDATAGYEYNHYATKVWNYASYYASGAKVPNTDQPHEFNIPQDNLISYFGRLNYSFNERYLLTASLRREGSSRFANHWGTYPAVAAAWKVKSESFLKNSKEISDLKIRAGYGITGQQDGIRDYAFLSTYALSASNASYQFGNTYYQMYRPSAYNPGLKWEQTATTNIGIDYGFMGDRITGSIDFYKKKTTHLLNNIPQPAGTNFDAFFIANVGDMNNKGIEFAINGQPIRNKNITWDVNYNITYNKNEITNLTAVPNDHNYRGIQVGNIGGGIGGGFAQIDAVGYSKNTFNLFKQIYDESGKPIEGLFEDKNRDGIINQDDLFKNKRADPDVIMGFSTNLNYKKWNAGFVLRASFGNYVDNNVYSNIGNLNQILGNYVLYNASANYLQTKFAGNSNNLLSDYFLENASFLRMDYFNIGYSVGKIYHDKANLRLNGIVQNVFVITKYKGLDPEISSGIDNNLYPRPRTLSLGLNLDF